MTNSEKRAVNKTLIFCFDGTCNDPGDVKNYAEDQSITNILKLHILFGGTIPTSGRTLQVKDGLEQRSFYYSGVGTRGDRFRRLRNMVFAFEHEDVKFILNDAVEDLKKHHENGSRVLVFGFSRGAALARRFASVAKKRSNIKSLEINFLGVFDTVASISSPSRGIGTDLSVETKPASDVVFENGIMSQDVKKAVHLVALDENRIAFQPTLFDYDPNRRITEVWFPGVHSDVGGGYWYDGLSDSALEYMIKKIEQECGKYVRIYKSEDVNDNQLTGKKRNNDKDYTQITKDDIKRKALVDGILHEHGRKTTSIQTAVTAGIATGVVAGIAVGIAVGLISSLMTGLIAGVIAGIIVGLITGVLVGMLVGVIVHRMISTKTLHPRDVRIADSPLRVHPMVHASVQHRYKEVRGYRPYALRNVKYVVVADDDTVSEVRQGISELWVDKKQESSTQHKQLPARSAECH